jgi:hypothetical protein
MVGGMVGASPKAHGDCQLGPTRFLNFQYLKSSQNCKFKSSAFLRSNNIKPLQGARYEHNQQLSQWVDFKFPTKIEQVQI